MAQITKAVAHIDGGGIQAKRISFLPDIAFKNKFFNTY